MSAGSSGQGRFERLVRATLPAGARGDHVFGDLREVYAEERGRLGPFSAGIRMVLRAIEVRVRMGGPPPGGGGRRTRGRWLQDLRQAGRSLRRAPGFTLVTSLTMALGLAAFTSVFAVLQAVLLEPPPLRDAEQLVALRVVDTDLSGGSTTDEYLPSFPQFADYRERTRTLSGVVGWRVDTPALEVGDGSPPLRVSVAAVTGEFFEVTGIEVAIGRAIQPSDETGGAPPVAVISHSLWLNQFGRDPDVLGRSLSLNGSPFEVVGILSDGFVGIPEGSNLPSTDTDVWLAHANSWLFDGADVRGLHNVSVLARVAEGVHAGALRADLDDISAQLAAEHENHVDERMIAVPVQTLLVGDARTPLTLLFLGCGIVLLLAMMNVMALTLSRASSRAAEMAVRQALGGDWVARARVLLAESFWIGGIGVLLGSALSAGLLEAARVSDAGLLPRLEQAGIGVGTLFLLGAVGLLGALLISVVPTISTRRPGSALRSSRGTTGRSGQRFRTGLVMAQMAGTVVLLSTSGLVLRSIAELRDTDLGFQADGVLVADLQLPTPFVSPEWPRSVAFFRLLAQELEAHPDVRAVGLAYQSPVDGGWSNGFTFSDRPEPPPGSGPSAIFRPVDAGYFATLGIPLIEGRGIETSDVSESAGVAVVNEAFARRFFEPGQSVIGTLMAYGDFWGARAPDYEIVGVVGDVSFNGAEVPTSPAIYFAHPQQPVHAMSVFVRTAGEPLSVATVLRSAVQELWPGLPVDGVSTLEEIVAAQMGPRRFLATILSVLAAIGSMLALVGLYGVLSYGVEMRRRELGIRLAIGADRRSVLGGILRRALLVVGAGLAGGVTISLYSTSLVRRFLFGTSPADPVVWGAAALLIAGLAVATGMIPARRAVRIDPMEALRAE